MQTAFNIFDLDMPQGGRVAMAPLPRAVGGEVERIAAWGATLVISATPADEMQRLGAGGVPAALMGRGIGWLSFAVADFDSPDYATNLGWPDVQARALEALNAGGRVLVHCRGGCGRSGMIVMRLMVVSGEAPDAALARLRKVRPCAVETEAQLVWASDALLP